MSDATKTAKLKYIICKTASICLTVMPLIIYIFIGLLNGQIHKGQKIFLGFTCIMAIILTIINILMKYHLRSPLFLTILGLYYAFDNILPLLLIICFGIVLDEFVFYPLRCKYKQKYIINKEIDKRQWHNHFLKRKLNLSWFI